MIDKKDVLIYNAKKITVYFGGN